MARQATSPVFLSRPRGGPSLFPSPNARGMARQVAQPLFCRAAFPLENAGASRRAIAAFSFRRPGTLCGGHPTCGRPPSASSWRAARSGHRVEPRRRPSACLRGTPAGAASCSTIKTPLDDALDEQDKIGLSSSRNKVNRVVKLPPEPCFRPARQAARAPGHRSPSQAIRLCARQGQRCRQKAA